MSALAQQVLAYTLVAVAGAWLLRRWLRRTAARRCDHCPPAPPSRPPAGAVRPDSLRVIR